ncbi:uncharacterized protein [Onthophagus taurus]
MAPTFFVSLIVSEIAYNNTQICPPCTSQNRNSTLANALINLSMTLEITIEQKYLEKGHTQMEADSMHSTIERRMRHTDINVPADYVNICLKAREKQPYKVFYLDYTFFKDFSHVKLFEIYTSRKAGWGSSRNRHTEEDTLKKSQWKPKLWLRYVDDIFVIWQHGQKRLQEFLDYLNSQHPMIKFTMETETAKKLPFLDVLVTRTTNGDMELGVYRKNTHTNRYLQACSHHHPQQKRSVIRTLFQRAARLCEGENLKKEQHFLRGVLQKNGYTSRDINQAIKQRKQKEDTVSTKPLGFICLPYVSGVTEGIARHLKKNDIVVRYGTVSKIRNTLPIAKDKLTPLKGAGVYRLSCSCGKVYVGQTGRNVECRIKEHERDVRPLLASHRTRRN